MDKKDQIILQQLDVIRSMTENNLRRMNTDFWGGTPFESVGKTPAAPSATLGAIMRHGPHHGAQKSSSTFLSDLMTSS